MKRTRRVLTRGHLAREELIPALAARRVAKVVAAVVLDVRGDAHPRDLSRAEVAAGGEGADPLLEEAELRRYQSYCSL